MDAQAHDLPESGVSFDETSAEEAHAWLLTVQERSQLCSPAIQLSKCFKPEATAQVLL